MDGNSIMYYNSALKLHLPVTECKVIEGLKLTFGKKSYYFFDKAVPDNSGSSTLIGINKYRVNFLLREAAIPVPKARAVDATQFNIDKLIKITQDLKFPLVVKPMLWSSKGMDVICNIPNLTVLIKICENLVKVYPFLLIEEYHSNLNDFRVLVYENKILDVVARYPAYVIGNGKDNIESLVNAKNIERINTSELLVPIAFDFESSICLQNQGLTKDSIPENGKKVQINYTCNAARGGELKSLPSTMHKENKKLFIKVANTLGFSLVGIDVVCKNLNEPITQTGGVIIEANDTPSIRIHEQGLGGIKKPVTLTVMKSYIYKHPFYYLLHLISQVKRRLLFAIIAAIVIITPSAILLLMMLMRSK